MAYKLNEREKRVEASLKPCPFCGGKARLELEFVPFGDDEANRWSVGCEDCGVGFTQLWEWDHIVYLWNERV